MGWTVLYIAFGIVALWLLGEVLLQYKARLRWRLLAFAGFLGVVVGVLMPSVVVIARRRDRLRRRPDLCHALLPPRLLHRLGDRRQPGREPPPQAAPGRDAAGRRAHARGLGPGVRGRAGRSRRAATEPRAGVYEPEPLPDDTGQYGVYSDAGLRGAAAADTDGRASSLRRSRTAGRYDGSTTPATASSSADAARTTYAGQYDYGDAGSRQYAAYSDPYMPAASSTTRLRQLRQLRRPAAVRRPVRAAAVRRDARPAGSGSRSSATASSSARRCRRSSRYAVRLRQPGPGTTSSSTATDRPGGRESAGSLRAAEVRPLHDQPGDQRPRHPGVREPAARVRPAAREVQPGQPGACSPGAADAPPAPASAGRGTEPPCAPVSPRCRRGCAPRPQQPLPHPGHGRAGRLDQRVGVPLAQRRVRPVDRAVRRRPSP